MRTLNRASIRQVAEVTELLVAAFPAVRYLQLFYRSVEACKSTHVSSDASYEEFVSITDTACSGLDWIIENIKAYNGKSFRTPSFSHTIESDASSLGCGARYGEHHTGGHWSPKEATYLDKTKVMIFNNSGKSLNNYSFRYGMNKLTLCPYGNFSLARQELKKVSLKALFKLWKEMGNHFSENIKLTIKLFDVLISPILMYGSEIWGID